ncbi:putative phage holin [Rhodococcus sp. 66b]|uniref:putative phage holin n=1 Tax=Rhodococcus sp. 66b TaxID=1945511 RepID=UPI0009D3E291|nr:hypothetical protein [Rhodococcus sp. 66b]OQM82008.1 hypothetical protein B0E55_01633 [Rhodococcus sp. 66b]
MKLIMLLAALAGVVIVGIFDPETEARIFLTSMTVLAWTFTIMYVTRSPWRATQGGRALLYTSAAIALLGTQLISVWWFGDYRFRAEVRDLVVVLLILTLLYRILVLFRIQQAARRDGESDHRTLVAKLRELLTRLRKRIQQSARRVSESDSTKEV